MSTRNPHGVKPYKIGCEQVYGIDWRDWLGFDALTDELQTITAEEWSITPVDGAPTLVPRGVFTDGLTAVALTTGGTAGVTYTLRCKATKSNGENEVGCIYITAVDV